jgi:hypothetical protein
MRTNDKPEGYLERKPLRLWPGIVIVLMQFMLRFVIPEIVPGAIGPGILGGVLLGLAIIIWWAFFSRAPKIERWGAIVLMAASLVATSFVLHISIATANMGLMYIFYSIPLMCWCNIYRFGILGIAPDKWNGWPNSSVFCMEVVKNTRGDITFTNRK